MSFASCTRFSAMAAAMALGFLVSGCGGGGGATAPSTSGVLPQAAASGGGRSAPLSAIGKIEKRIRNADALEHTSGKVRVASVTPSNVTTADPPVRHPNEPACVVQLFSNVQFVDFSQHTFPYAPSCPGPWAKVVFVGDFSVTAGRQFDRTGSVWLDGTNIYFGTTAEPSAARSPSWHVERDVTDLSAIFQGPSTGQVVLGNIVDSTYTGIISASGKLEFYPATKTIREADVADNVYPLSGSPLGDNQYIHTPQEPLTATYTFPANVRAAYLDVFLQSQIGDEFWYTCLPNDLAPKLNNCGNTAFREGDVAIDGQAAGVVPIYPWIYTGGLDPYLWRPIPGVETLNFKPYRVDLTPFAGILSNGQPHTVTVNVFNNGNYFAANGALLVFLDHGSKQVTGGIISDRTPLAPSPIVTDGVTFNSQGLGTGPVNVTAFRNVSIDGYVQTSAGRIETQVQQQIGFTNQQRINANTSGSIFDQNIKQNTFITSEITTISGAGDRRWVHAIKEWPLSLDYTFNVNPDGSAVQTAAIEQGKIEQSTAHTTGQGMPWSRLTSNTVKTSDTLTFPASGGDIPSNGKSTQTYFEHDSDGYCYGKTVSSLNYIVTSQGGSSCW